MGGGGAGPGSAAAAALAGLNNGSGGGAAAPPQQRDENGYAMSEEASGGLSGGPCANGVHSKSDTPPVVSARRDRRVARGRAHHTSQVGPCAPRIPGPRRRPSPAASTTVSCAGSARCRDATARRDSVSGGRRNKSHETQSPGRAESRISRICPIEDCGPCSTRRSSHHDRTHTARTSPTTIRSRR